MRLHHGFVFSLLACNVALAPVGFDIPYNVPEQEVPGDPTANAAGIVVDAPPITFPVNVDVASYEKANGVNVISSIELTQLSLTITTTDEPTGDTDCFDFVQSVSLSIASTKSGTTLQPVVIATGGSPGCVQTYTLTPTPNVNVKPYIDEGASVTMTGQAIPPADNVSFDGALVMHASI